MSSGSEVSTVTGPGRGECGGADHGIDGVLVAVASRLGQERCRVPGKNFGDRLDHEPGECPIQRSPVDPGMNDLDERHSASDDTQIVGERQREPALSAPGRVVQPLPGPRYPARASLPVSRSDGSSGAGVVAAGPW
jgi:hypothetical protein